MIAGYRLKGAQMGMKKKVLFPAALLMAFMVLTACSPEQDSGQDEVSSKVNTSQTKATPKLNYQQLDKELKTNSAIKEGADVSAYVDPDGNTGFVYQNPDGKGGGGGVILD